MRFLCLALLALVWSSVQAKQSKLYAPEQTCEDVLDSPCVSKWKDIKKKFGKGDLKHACMESRKACYMESKGLSLYYPLLCSAKQKTGVLYDCGCCIYT